MATVLIRAATGLTDPGVQRSTGPYVIHTATTFETDPPTAAQMAARIRHASELHAWLIAVDDGQIVGYACRSDVVRGAARPAGRTWLPERGYRIALAGMTLPNPGSVGLHHALPFEPVGTYRDVGWKNGAWHDVARMQKVIAARPGVPAEPR